MSNTFRCTCGQVWKMIPLSGQHLGGNWQRGQDFALGAVPAGAEFSRETPHRAASTEADVIVPLWQAVICGAVTALLAAVGTMAKDWHWATPIVAGVAVFAVAWWLLLVDHRRLLRKVETFVGADLDGDGAVGDPAFQVEITESLSDGQKRMKFCTFPGKPEQVARFAMAALNGQLTVHGNHGLSQSMFAKLRDEALSRGLLVWRNPDAHNQGVEMTLAGKCVFKRLTE